MTQKLNKRKVVKIYRNFNKKTKEKLFWVCYYAQTDEFSTEELLSMLYSI